MLYNVIPIGKVILNNDVMAMTSLKCAYIRFSTIKCGYMLDNVISIRQVILDNDVT